MSVYNTHISSEYPYSDDSISPCFFIFCMQEGMLNSLQNHVEREENRWSEQVQLLQTELKSITDERDALLRRTKVFVSAYKNFFFSNEIFV